MSARISHTEIVDIVEYDVEKFGEPNVPKDPDFTPYLGEVEEPKEVKPFHKKIGFWFAAFVIILILSLILL